MYISRMRRSLLFITLGLTVVIFLLRQRGSGPDDGFQLPTDRECLAALGDLSALTPDLQRSFKLSRDEVRLSSPNDRDWLANHVEFGQPFAQFVNSAPNLPTAERNKIYL